MHYHLKLLNEALKVAFSGNLGLNTELEYLQKKIGAVSVS